MARKVKSKAIETTGTESEPKSPKKRTETRAKSPPKAKISPKPKKAVTKGKRTTKAKTQSSDEDINVVKINANDEIGNALNPTPTTTPSSPQKRNRSQSPKKVSPKRAPKRGAKKAVNSSSPKKSAKNAPKNKKTAKSSSPTRSRSSSPKKDLTTTENSSVDEIPENSNAVTDEAKAETQSSPKKGRKGVSKTKTAAVKVLNAKNVTKKKAVSPPIQSVSSGDETGVVSTTTPSSPRSPRKSISPKKSPAAKKKALKKKSTPAKRLTAKKATTGSPKPKRGAKKPTKKA